MCSTASVACVLITDAYLVKEASIPSFEGVLPIKQDGARVSLAVHKFLQKFQTAITKPEIAPFPVIVAVHGSVVGLGVDIMCACDVRYAAENSTFSIKVNFPYRFTIRNYLHRSQMLG